MMADTAPSKTTTRVLSGTYESLNSAMNRSGFQQSTQIGTYERATEPIYQNHSPVSNEQYNYSNELVKRHQTAQFSNYSPEKLRRAASSGSGAEQAAQSSPNGADLNTSRFDSKRATAELDQIIDELLNFSISSETPTISRNRVSASNFCEHRPESAGTDTRFHTMTSSRLSSTTPQRPATTTVTRTTTYYDSRSGTASASSADSSIDARRSVHNDSTDNLYQNLNDVVNVQRYQHTSTLQPPILAQRPPSRNECEHVVMRSHQNGSAVNSRLVDTVRSQGGHTLQLQSTAGSSTYQTVTPTRITVTSSHSVVSGSTPLSDEKKERITRFSNGSEDIGVATASRRSQVVEETQNKQYQTAQVEVYEEVESIALEPIGKGVHDLVSSNTSRLSLTANRNSSSTLAAPPAIVKPSGFVEQDVEVVTFQPIGGGVKDLGHPIPAQTMRQSTLMPRNTTTPRASTAVVYQAQTLNRNLKHPGVIHQQAHAVALKAANSPSSPMHAELDIPVDSKPVAKLNRDSTATATVTVTMNRNVMQSFDNSTDSPSKRSASELESPTTPTTSASFTEGPYASTQEDSSTDPEQTEIIMRHAQPTQAMNRSNVYSTVMRESRTTGSLVNSAFQNSPSSPLGGGTYFAGSPSDGTQRRVGSISQLTDSFGRTNSYNSSLAFAASPDDVQRRIMMIQDRSRWWYKPNMPREEIVSTLLKMRSGSFLVRKSNTYPGAYGIAIRVDEVPSSAPRTGDPEKDLIRHFLLEPTSKGIRVRGFPNEPVFSSLSGLIYQHTVTALGLPCRLVLPDYDPAPQYSELNQSTLSLLSITKTSGSPDNNLANAQVAGIMNSIESLSGQSTEGPSVTTTVIYVGGVDVESLSGPQALSRAFQELRTMHKAQQTSIAEVKLTINTQGVTITDVNRKMFFRKHLPLTTVLYAGTDPEDRRLTDVTKKGGTNAKLWSVVARKQTGPLSGSAVFENMCHVFAELSQSIPLAGLVSFLNQLLPSAAQ